MDFFGVTWMMADTSRNLCNLYRHADLKDTETRVEVIVNATLFTMGAFFIAFKFKEAWDK